MKIAHLDIGPEHPCRIICEISNNHNGSLDRALRLIDIAKRAGADIIKTQCYQPSELVALRGDGPAPEPWGSAGWTMAELYERAQTPLDWFPAIAAHCERIGMLWFSSVFGRDSLACLEAVGCPAYKISKFEHRIGWLGEAVNATGRPVLVSAPHDYDHASVAADGVLLCPGGYPCAVDDVQLPRDFQAAGYLGLSSHCLDPRLPIAAVARGAKILEYHFQLDDEPSVLERDVSLTASQFAAMVRDVRATEALLA